MENSLHFISGLPRAGTTLLAAILQQNPAFHAKMTGPAGAIFEAVQGSISGENEFSRFMSAEQKEAHLKGVFDAHYKGLDKNVTVFDTHRVWTSKAGVLKSLYPKSYLFCCVREVSWILDSLERIIARNPLELSRIYKFERTNTVYSRVDGLTAGSGLVGFAYNALKGAFYSEAADRLVLIRYDSLTKDPAGVIGQIYQMVGASPFKHDFENVEYSEGEYDSWLGTPGLHDIRKKVEATERQTVLPPDIFNRFHTQTFWEERGANFRNVKII